MLGLIVLFCILIACGALIFFGLTITVAIKTIYFVPLTVNQIEEIRGFYTFSAICSLLLIAFIVGNLSNKK